MLSVHMLFNISLQWKVTIQSRMFGHVKNLAFIGGVISELAKLTVKFLSPEGSTVSSNASCYISE